MTRNGGFSMVELVVAMAVLLAVIASLFAVLGPNDSAFAVQLEAADMQQRLRVVADTFYRDLVMAGAGMSQGTSSGSLAYYFAPVLPYRHASGDDDPPGTFTNERITLMYVPATAAQTTLATSGPGAGTGSVGVAAGAGCPAGDPSCGFTRGTTALLYDSSGLYDTFAVESVQSSTLTLRHTGDRVTYANYQAHSTNLTQFTNAVYYLKRDPATGIGQLMFSDGGLGADVPVVDHVAAITFAYYGDPQPPRLTGAPLGGLAGPWTTYGPPPPELGRQIPSGGYPTGENCTFAVDPATGEHVPRLAILGGGPLIQLTASQLDGSDGGPWCPDAANPNRWDADLLRIRAVDVTVRVEAADAALRGPASLLFTHGGTSTNGHRWLPDQEIRFQVAPRNLRLGRRP